MKKLGFLVVCLLLICFSQAYAQNSIDPNSSKKSSTTFKKNKVASKKAYNKKYDQAIVDAQKLKKKNKKKYAKMEKGMKKPQYSNPLYFGHKKRPKIRKEGKRKMCKECGIVH